MFTSDFCREKNGHMVNTEFWYYPPNYFKLCCILSIKKKDDMLSKNNSIEYKSKTMRKALNWKAVTDDEWKMEEIWHIKSIYKTNGK